MPARADFSASSVELLREQLGSTQASLRKAEGTIDEYIRMVAVLEDKLRARDVEVHALQEEGQVLRREIAQKDQLLKQTGRPSAASRGHESEAQMAHQSQNAFLSCELMKTQKELASQVEYHQNQVAQLHVKVGQQQRELDRLVLERKYLAAKYGLDLLSGSAAEEYRSFKTLESQLEESRKVNKSLSEKYFHSLAVMAKMNASGGGPGVNSVSVADMYEKASSANISWENFPSWIAQEIREELRRAPRQPPPEESRHPHHHHHHQDSSSSSSSSRHLSSSRLPPAPEPPLVVPVFKSRPAAAKRNPDPAPYFGSMPPAGGSRDGFPHVQEYQF